MSRLTPVAIESAQGQTEQMFTAIKGKLGMVPNMMRTMAQSTAALNAYLSMSGALGSGLLTPGLREAIALAAAETNACDYCASAHSILGKMAGLNPDEIVANRQGHSPDSKTDAALTFVKALIAERGNVASSFLDKVKAAGFSEGEIAEMVAHVALNVYTNYFNRVAQTDIDFPVVKTGQK